MPGVLIIEAMAQAGGVLLLTSVDDSRGKLVFFIGIDAVALATGQDWRAVEAGAHAYAARDGQYRSLTEWQVGQGHLVGRLQLPLAVGTVGGLIKSHPTVRTALKILGNPDARMLSEVMAAAGLAQNLAALRALVTEGIQHGHMALHDKRKLLIK